MAQHTTKIDHTITVHKELDSLIITLKDDSGVGGDVDIGRQIQACGIGYLVPLVGGHSTFCGMREARYLSDIIDRWLE